MKTYIEKAQEVYDNIIDYKIEAYRFFILQTLSGYGINKVGQLKVLAKMLDSQESRFLEFHILENDNFRHSFRDKSDESMNLSNDRRFKEDMSKAPSGQYSIIAALIIYENFGNEVKEAEQPKSDFTNDELSPLLKRYFGEFCIAYTYRYNKKDFFTYYDALTQLFFAYLWKSIAVGEFYIVPNYCDIIKHRVGLEVNTKMLPAFVSYLPDIRSALSTFVNRVSPSNGSNYELHFDLEQDLIVNSVSEKYAKPDFLKLLMGLTQKLFEITIIDLRYFASHRNLYRLVNFIYGFDRYINNLSTQKTTSYQSMSIFLANAFGFDALIFLKDTMTALIFKSCVMAKQIIIQPSPDRTLCFDYDTLANSDINSIIDYYCHYYTDNSQDFFLELYNQYANTDISCQSNFQKKLEDCRQNNKRYSAQNFIRVYNDNIDKGISSYIADSKLYSVLKSGSDVDIMQCVKKYVSNHDNIESTKFASPSALVKSILWMSQHLKSNMSHEHEDIYSYGKLLNCLRLFTIAYKNGKNAPLRFRSYFEYSFCKVEKEKVTKVHIEASKLQKYGDNINCIKDCIFFASQGYFPINMEYLESIFLKYNREFRILESKAIEDSIKSSTELSGKMNATVEIIKEERGRTLQLLGLLGAFIAFVSSLVGMQKVAENIYDFMLFTLTFMSGILVFVLCVYRITETFKMSQKEVTNERKTSIFDNYAVLLLCLIISIVMLVFFRHCRNDITNTNNTESTCSKSTNNIVVTNVSEVENTQDSLPPTTPLHP